MGTLNQRASIAFLFERGFEYDQIQSARNSKASYVDSFKSIKEANPYQGRLDHDPKTGEELGFKDEEKRTNHFLYSEDFSQTSWIKDPGNTIENNTTTAHGKNEWVATVSVGSGFYQTVSHVPGEVFCSWFLVRAGSISEISFSISGSVSHRISFDLINLQHDVDPGLTVFLEEWSFGYLLIGVSRAFSTVGVANFGLTGDTPGTFYLLLGQAEGGSFPTSYIKTGATTATREKDISTVALGQNQLNRVEGSFVISFNIKHLGSADNSEPTSAFYAKISNNNSVDVIFKNPEKQSEHLVSGIVVGKNKLFCSYQSGEFKTILNTSEPIITTTGNVNNDFDTLAIGGGHESLGNINGHFGRVFHWPLVIDTEIAQDLLEAI